MTTSFNDAVLDLQTVVEAYRLDRYDNFNDDCLQPSGDSCRSLSFG